MRKLGPNRHVALVALMIGVTLFGEVGCAGKPNIVIILADDMGYGDAGCYNAESQIPTPHLDRLAQQGMRFTDAHSPSAVCSPARYGLLTGRYAWRTELKRQVLWPWDRPLIEEGRLTLASMLNQHGYHSACIGKWHLGWVWKTAEGTPMPTSLKIGQGNHDLRVKLAKVIDYTQPLGGGPPGAGFDYYFGDGVINQPPYLWIQNNRCLTQPTEPWLKSIKDGSSNGPATPGWDQAKVLPRITERAMQYIRERGEKKDVPFFLYLSLTAPHTPLMPSEPYAGKTVVGPYGDFVHQVDAIIGQVTEALDRAGLTDNTLVLFTSDNGSFASPMKGHRPNGNWRGKKGQIFEGGHRVPFIVRWPGKVESGSVNRQLVGINDLAATIAAIVDHALPNNAGEDSVDLLPTLLDPSKPVRHDLVHHSDHGVFAIREGDWKLILSKGAGGPGGMKPKPADPPGQLYNLATDPGEKDNLYTKHPEVVERLSAQLEQYRRDDQSVRRGE